VIREEAMGHPEAQRLWAREGGSSWRSSPVWSLSSAGSSASAGSAAGDGAA